MIRPTDRARMGILLATALMLGCDGGAPGALPTVRDSAGVAVAHNPRAALEAAPWWSIPEAPAWSVGVAEGDSLAVLFQVEDAATLSDDRVAVLTREGIRSLLEATPVAEELPAAVAGVRRHRRHRRPGGVERVRAYRLETGG